HPDCYTFSTSNGRGKSFIGASPERLISIDDGKLITDALAGSAPRGKTVAEDADLANRLLCSEKERYEHRIVVDFMMQHLQHLGIKPFCADIPGLLQLSNIQHLHTPIQASVPASVHPLEIVTALHPTPAVAGAPREVACAQIKRYETFERSLYAAPLGWIDHQGNSEFIVGIRSALIAGNHARLYAGAGIVDGSDPDRELAEIRLKLQALLQALV
ncbi:MAG: isochorismate synthase, partial [Cyanothece sp. SIO1E1]|nr:isochorismate synthase [Cyanothece sp. SIO1E1]